MLPLAERVMEWGEGGGRTAGSAFGGLAERFDFVGVSGAAGVDGLRWRRGAFIFMFVVGKEAGV